MLFSEELKDWESWGKVFYSINAFTQLIGEILRNEQLIVEGKIENLTPGSNAVFKIDNLVIKIYAPLETGVDTEYDYNVELNTMEFANKEGASVPKIIASGEIQDKYLFRYIIMEFKANDIQVSEIFSYSIKEKQDFVEKIKDILHKLNKPVKLMCKSISTNNQNEQLTRMKELNRELIRDLVEYSSKVCCDSMVLVHGDITRDNILINKNNDITVIDFADCIQAPAYYEFPAIIFELFMCDREFVSCFVGNDDKDTFLELLIKGLSIHSYCGNILKDYFIRIGMPLDKIDSIESLKGLLKKELS